MVEVVSYGPEHYQGILELLDDTPFKERVWDWQFKDRAVCDHFDPVVLVDGDAVVGFNGVMAAPLKYGNQYVEGLWSCDFYITASHRGQGLGRVIKEALMEKAPVVMSFGVSPKAAAVLEHMGWQCSDEVWNYRHYRRSLSLRDFALRCLQGLNRLRGIRAPGYTGNLFWADSLPGPGEVDALWERTAPSLHKSVYRTHAYMEWKYERHPMARYAFLLGRDKQGTLEAVMVVRRKGESVRIVDWIGDPAREDLVASMVIECRRSYQDARVFSVTTSHDRMGLSLEKCGFFRSRTQPSFYVRSTLPGDTNPEKGWFIMGGDSDGELLSAAREEFKGGVKV